jgi:hypothetical protein
MVTLPLATRLVCEVTDAVSGLDAAAAEELGMVGEVEALDGVLAPDAVPGFV